MVSEDCYVIYHVCSALIQSRNRFTNVKNLKCWFQWSNTFLRAQLKDPAILVFLALYFRIFKPLEQRRTYIESSHGRKCKELGAVALGSKIGLNSYTVFAMSQFLTTRQAEEL